MSTKIVFYSFDNFYGNRWINKIGCSYFTAEAPASINSIAIGSVHDTTHSITGILTARAVSHTILNANGLIAGPDNPPVTVERQGFRVSASIAIPSTVFISEIASAPASSTALAIRKYQ
jgi:hypothetical protein